MFLHLIDEQELFTVVKQCKGKSSTGSDEAADPGGSWESQDPLSLGLGGGLDPPLSVTNIMMKDKIGCIGPI